MFVYEINTPLGIEPVQSGIIADHINYSSINQCRPGNTCKYIVCYKDAFVYPIA